MPVEANRATFVQAEYRYDTAENLTIKATYPAARELVHETNLDTVDAAILAGLMLLESGVMAQAYKIIVEGIYHLEDIDGGPLRFVLDLPMYLTDGRTFKVTRFDVDYMENRTSFEVRG